MTPNDPNDFANSVILEELDPETLPAELMAEFEQSALGLLPQIEEEDIWSHNSEVAKNSIKR